MAAADTSQEKRYLSCAETAKLVRKALKADFPGVKFSVRSSTYAGGASIHVGWTDGPSEREVDATLGLYQGSTFDGMTDMKSYHDSFLMGEDGLPELVHFGADFVTPSRSISEEKKAEYMEEIRDLVRHPVEYGGRVGAIVHEDGSLGLLTGSTEWVQDVLYQMSVRRAS